MFSIIHLDGYGLVWINLVYAREATYNEVDVIMKLKEDLYYIDVYEKSKNVIDIWSG